jgi:Uma2 family endonuclease
MTATTTPKWRWPQCHKALPETDGSIVENFLEHPQGILLTDSILPLLRQRHPENDFCVGQDSGIYWRKTDPPLRGCKAPDWFYVPHVAPTPAGEYRRSYVLWEELVSPLIVVEFVSGDGSEERDQTPNTGKFWVYEQEIRAPFYAIYEVDPGRVEVYQLIDEKYQLLAANASGRYPIAPLGVELGIWRGQYLYPDEVPWLRWWDTQGNMLPTGEERAEQERQRTQRARQTAKRERLIAERERQRAEREQQNAERERQNAERERQNAEREQQNAEQERQTAEQERQTAEQERQTAEQERQRASSAEERAIRLAERLRALGIDPDKE